MCGIAGVLDLDASTPAGELAATAARMAATLEHRGPDDHDVWVDAEAGIAIGHRRLAIVDLSADGHQPMHSASGRYVIAYNGELYNAGPLHDELRTAHHFRGHCDTEVLLAAIERWGLAGALERANGMFALALWDRRTRVLHLARDRLGEKPLYHARRGARLLFGSELKALLPIAGTDIDRDSVAAYLRLGYVPAPRTIYAGVHKLSPGHTLAIRPDGTTEVRAWWDPGTELCRAAADRLTGASDDELVDDAHQRLRQAVAMRMHADRPLGAFLSGGIDSSLVVALMQAEADRPVRTFTVGFAEASHDERSDAGAVARYLGTDHTEIGLAPAEALALVGRLPDIWDEPFGDPSQLPTALVAAATRQHVTVALSGDGGDEVFGGYNRYTLSRAAQRWTGRLPAPLRRGIGTTLLAAPPAAWDRATRPLRVRNPGQKVQKLGTMLRTDDPYLSLVSQWDDPGAVVVGGTEPPLDTPECAAVTDPTERMMLADSLRTLPDQMLVKVDRATMAVGLEARVPLLDHQLVTWAWRLPLAARIRGGQGKWILRRVLDHHVPAALVDRPKMGFDPPVAAWLRGPLRPWAEALLAPERLAAEGYLWPGPVAVRWRRHQAGRRDESAALWTVLMFQSWLERWQR
jgi:asparagine synthase (glutamine-hydrolysing)